MKPHDQITFIRNRHRAQELRRFRDLVELYFEQARRDANDVAMDWDGMQVTRSRINQRLPRVIQVVRAAGLGERARPATWTDPGLRLGRVDVLERIFSARSDALDQEVLDLLDMAIGVYEGDLVATLLRTVNPFHYAATAFGYVARAPRAMLRAFGVSRGGEIPPIPPADPARLEALTSQLAELAERLDFTERVLARQQQSRQVSAPEPGDLATPV